MTVDNDGMLWVALGKAGAVHRYDRSARLVAVLELPTSNPTSIAFGGVDGGDLFITTSWFDLEEDDRLSQPLAGANPPASAWCDRWGLDLATGGHESNERHLPPEFLRPPLVLVTLREHRQRGRRYELTTTLDRDPHPQPDLDRALDAIDTVGDEDPALPDGGPPLS